MALTIIQYARGGYNHIYLASFCLLLMVFFCENLSVPFIQSKTCYLYLCGWQPNEYRLMMSWCQCFVCARVFVLILPNWTHTVFVYFERVEMFLYIYLKMRWYGCVDGVCLELKCLFHAISYFQRLFGGWKKVCQFSF